MTAAIGIEFEIESEGMLNMLAANHFYGLNLTWSQLEYERRHAMSQPQ